VVGGGDIPADDSVVGGGDIPADDSVVGDGDVPEDDSVVGGGDVPQDDNVVGGRDVPQDDSVVDGWEVAQDDSLVVWIDSESGGVAVRDLLLTLEVWIPIGAEVFPCGVCGLDEGDLSGTKPPFQFFFALDGDAYVIGLFEPDQAIAVVACGESFVGFRLVFEDAMAEVAGDADVKCAAFAGDDVGEVEVVAHVR
jgi:hypothetical protein